jgi:large subunit ribosomal protein L15
MRLNQLADLRAHNKKRKRVGRGVGSGLGKTCGHGQKGQKSRTGVAINGFEGGQMPLHRRLPKRGFVSLNQDSVAIVNLEALQQAVDSGKIQSSKEIGLETLQQAGLVRPNAQAVKILAKGALKTALNLKVDFASEAARQLVIKAGGSVSLGE